MNIMVERSTRLTSLISAVDMVGYCLLSKRRHCVLVLTCNAMRLAHWHPIHVSLKVTGSGVSDVDFTHGFLHVGCTCAGDCVGTFEGVSQLSFVL